eukprot:3256022-Karenia_brevis.AAC.1
MSTSKVQAVFGRRENNDSPLFAAPHNALIDGHYNCDNCRCPMCRSCGINQKPTLRSNTSFDKNVICDECKVKEQESDTK